MAEARRKRKNALLNTAAARYETKDVTVRSSFPGEFWDDYSVFGLDGGLTDTFLFDFP